MKPIAPNKVERILIIKMWAMGDILMATPLLTALKRAYPNCSITWMAETVHAGILESNPLIDQVLEFDSTSWRRTLRSGNFAAYVAMAVKFRHTITSGNYDLAINLTGEKWWSTLFALAPVRIALFNDLKVGWIRAFYNHIITRTPEPWLHNTTHYLLVMKALGIDGPFDEHIVLGISDTDRATVDEFLKDNGHDPARPIVVFHPGTSRPTKSWSTANFAAAANVISETAQIVITGSPAERELAEDIAGRINPSVPRPLVAAGVLQCILQTAALIERSAAIVTGDTSALHMASALGVPVVAIYGSTRPKDNAPQFGPSRLLYAAELACSPCFKEKCPFTGEAHMACMKAITPNAVVAAVRLLIAEKSAAT